MKKIVVIGGGWAGCATAISAKKAGANVTLIERTDMLLGLGNVGGIMRNNGRYTASEECILLGGREIFEITDMCSRHKNIDFPGHKHASLYDVNIIEAFVRRKLEDMNIKILFKSRVVDVNLNGSKIEAVVLEDGKTIKADSFIETTGSTGSMGNCLKYGNGCAMCVLRCPSFGPRVSITQKCGLKDIIGKRNDGSYGAFSGSVKLNKESLSEEIRNELNKNGLVVVPLPKEEINHGKLDIKVCQQYALDEFAKNLILLDTGHAKLMVPFYPLEKLRKIKGFENARYEDPYSGGIGNSIRYLSVAKRDNSLKVKGIDNLFVAGEKSGFYVGHTEAIVTGYLAGHNSVRNCIGIPLLNLPRNIAIGDLIAYGNEILNNEESDKVKITFAGSIYFERMKKLGLYTLDKDYLREKISKLGLINIYDEKIV
ncbi:2-polyprenyl-6-methoxyphenol hydroxylase and related FAD-dependent oxidoreductases [Alkalithermobacter thermoalcaliphilus JW-YL-7 = DSM 7308]|uniref:2-polyprenyl-6-methoxyphenol hydroxylase and related FAD-dependent oxidoreductases n=1 Tax=Alkalithermobacter thermoalcaliphilus JW-YL-7 = DSM 7308 TaxID=1121328 RepID=A0A150FQM9_CLOPD|nr:glucose-inhibited division protein A [[Clostridium] paradoxum JW-YL-7 = DSM 7308]SHK77731.1 2-polyprenyl-6-methoxyphenol hydroxylase and related FAD-dependent oxidoreductases [[Clostridium] paradoxum JW-YL-7 = DSM 7308]